MCENVIQKKEAPAKKQAKDDQITSVAAVTTLPQIKKTERTLRSFIPTATQKYVFQNAENCCEYISADTGRKCGSRYQLQIDHRTPLERGGGNNPENLRLLCRTHNLAEAKRWGLHR
jgi:5-methylcytosine-specific restriction endonuclease McrA